MNRRHFLKLLTGAVSLAVWPFGLPGAGRAKAKSKYPAIGMESTPGVAVGQEVGHEWDSYTYSYRYPFAPAPYGFTMMAGEPIEPGQLVQLNSDGKVYPWDHISFVIGATQTGAGPGEMVTLIRKYVPGADMQV